MKKIINYKKYDTETATKISEWRRGRRFDKVHECLYRKKTGEYFLYGEGGAKSKYRKSIGTNWWSGSERIIPMTTEEAKTWGSEHMDEEAYEKEFQ